MVTGETKFRATVFLQFTKEELEVMLFCSQRHYDGRCQLASKQGGFLYGIKNRMDVHFEIHGQKNGLPFHDLNIDDLDTLAKILETPPVDQYAVGYRLHSEVVKSLRTAIEASETVSDGYNGWQKAIEAVRVAFSEPGADTCDPLDVIRSVENQR